MSNDEQHDSEAPLLPAVPPRGGSIAHLAGGAASVTGCLADDVDGDGLVDLVLPTPLGQERGRPGLLLSSAWRDSQDPDLTPAVLRVVERSWDVAPIDLFGRGGKALVALQQVLWGAGNLTTELANLRKRLPADKREMLGHPDPETPVLGAVDLVVLVSADDAKQAGWDVSATEPSSSAAQSNGSGSEQADAGRVNGETQGDHLRDNKATIVTARSVGVPTQHEIQTMHPEQLEEMHRTNASAITPCHELLRIPLWIDVKHTAGVRLERADVNNDGLEDLIVLPQPRQQSTGHTAPAANADEDIASPGIAARCGAGPCEEVPELAPWVALVAQASSASPSAVRVEGQQAAASTLAVLVDQEDTATATSPSILQLAAARSFGGALWRDPPLQAAWPPSASDVVVQVVVERHLPDLRVTTASRLAVVNAQPGPWPGGIGVQVDWQAQPRPHATLHHRSAASSTQED